MTDSSIISAEDKRDQFEALALPFTKSIYNTALRLTHRPEDASDLVQETCLRAYRTFSNFTPGTNCKAWLFTIMYSVFVNRYRKEQREPKSVSIEELEEKFHRSLAAAEWDSHLAPNPGEMGTEVDRALNQLPESFRLTVLLVDVEEMTYEEAAAILNCPVELCAPVCFERASCCSLNYSGMRGKRGTLEAHRCKNGNRESTFQRGDAGAIG